MKKTYGVYFGMLTLGLAALGAPASRAQARLAANGAGGAAVASETSTATPTASASSASDLDRRIEALEEELVSLRNEMTARKESEEAAAAPAVKPAVAAPQDATKTT